ncbi:MAG: hypothetical protein NDI90_11140 [Nitrospira sp. BO4]|jgi:MFS family permease|nr:hypothetical protein [Nitrospira sp. BO4]
MSLFKFSPSTFSIGACWFLTSVVFYTLNIAQLAPLFFSDEAQVALVGNDGSFFGADTVEIADAMRALTVNGDMRKHPLFSIVTAPMVDAVGWLFRIDENRSVIVTLGLISAGNVTFAWWILSQFAVSKTLGLALSVMYGLMFSNLTFFSIPETYSLSGLAVEAYVCLLLALGNKRTGRSAVLLGTAAGFAGLLNPPLLSLSLVGIVYGWNWGREKEALRYGILTIVVACLVFCLPYALVYGRSILGFSRDYANHYASLSNLLEVEKVASVAVSFFLFSVVSPVVSLAGNISLPQLLGYVNNPIAAATLIFYLVIGVVAIGQAIRCSDALVLPIAIWVLTMLAFYVFFNPREGFLYSSQVLFPLTMLAARGLAKIPLADHYKAALVAILSVLLGLNNLPVLYGQAM